MGGLESSWLNLFSVLRRAESWASALIALGVTNNVSAPFNPPFYNLMLQVCRDLTLIEVADRLTLMRVIFERFLLLNFN